MTSILLTIGALATLLALLPVSSWLAIGRRSGLPAGTRWSLWRQRRRLRAKLPRDRMVRR